MPSSQKFRGIFFVILIFCKFYNIRFSCCVKDLYPGTPDFFFSSANAHALSSRRSRWRDDARKERDQRRLDSRPQSIMGIERLIPRVTSLPVDCRGVNISLTKPIWKLSNDKSVRLRYFVKRNSMLLLYCCDHHYDLCFTIPSLPFLNICMGHAVILA